MMELSNINQNKNFQNTLHKNFNLCMVELISVRRHQKKTIHYHNKRNLVDLLEERRRELPRNRRRPIPEEPHYEEPRPAPERIDIDIRRMNSDNEDCDDDHTPLNCSVDLTQIVNESVIWWQMLLFV